MEILISGLTLFLFFHLLPSSPKAKGFLINKLGIKAYTILFNVASLLGIILIVYGYKNSSFVSLYATPAWGKSAAMVLMLPAVYLFMSNAAGSAPSSAQVKTAHPLSWGVIFWATGHLLANGDVAGILIFATFLLFSAISIATGKFRGLKPRKEKRPPLIQETGFIAIALLIYAALAWGHGYYTGVEII